MAWLQDWYSGLGPAMQTLVQATWQASVLVMLVLAVQMMFGRWLNARWRYALWSVVVLRLMLPVTPGSVVSVFNLFRGEAEAVVVAELPAAPVSAPINMEAIDLSGLEPVVSTAGGQAYEPVSHWHTADIVLAVWLMGVVLVLGVLLLINAVLAVRLRRHASVTDEGLLALLESCKREMGLHRNVRLLLIPKLASPALAGMFRPKLLVPAALVDQMPEHELRFVFLHELAHMKKHDIAMNWLLILLAAVHWFNPLVWFAFARLRADRELARDALVLRATGTDASQAYGQTIIRVLEQLTRPRLANPALAGIGDGMGQLKRRIRMIALSPKRRPALTVVGVMLLATLAVIGLTDAAEPGAEEAANVPMSNVEVDDDPGVGTDAVGDIHIKLEAGSSTQTYNMRDLLASGLYPEGMSAEARPRRSKMIDDIQSAIAETVGQYTEWSVNGGSQSTIQQVGDTLVIKTTSANHAAIKRLLVELPGKGPADSDAAEAGAIRVYDLRSLLASDPGAKDVPTGQRPTRNEILGQIVMAIAANVGDFNEWSINGGDRSFIASVGDKLIIKTTPENHEEIKRLLGQLDKGIQTREIGVDDDSSMNLIGEWSTLDSDPDPVVITFAENGVATITDDPHPTETYRYTLHGDQLLLKQGGDTLEFTYRLMGSEDLLVTFNGNTTPFTRSSTKPIQTSLDQVIRVNFKENRLANVIDYVRNVTGTDIYVNWRALKAVGVAMDTQITLLSEGPEVTGRSVLERVLELASESSTEPITFGIRGRVVVVSTQADVVAAQVGYPIEIPSADKDREATMQALNKLNHPIPINFESNRLANILDYFRNVTKVNLFVDWAALKQAGVYQDALVSLKLNNIDATEALRLVLHQVSCGAKERIEFRVIDGIVTIATTNKLVSAPTMEEVEAEVARTSGQKLRQPIRVDFDNVPFEDAVQTIGDKLGMPVYVNWERLKEAGIEPTTAVSLRTGEMPGDKVLNLVFQVMSEKAQYKGYNRPAFILAKGTVAISTERDQINPDTRVYDIRHLLRVAEADVEPLPLAPRADGTVPERVERDTPGRAQQVEQVATTIRKSVGYYDEWEANGGDISSISEENGNLIVKTTRKNHKAIEQLLAQLGKGAQARDREEDKADNH